MTDDYSAAATRHRGDGRHLASHERFQNAGHLVGLAAECLAKAVLERAGIKINKPSGLQVHFPELGGKIRRMARSRAISALAPILRNSKFLDGWQVGNRYENVLSRPDAERRLREWLSDTNALFKSARQR